MSRCFNWSSWELVTSPRSDIYIQLDQNEPHECWIIWIIKSASSRFLIWSSWSWLLGHFVNSDLGHFKRLIMLLTLIYVLETRESPPGRWCRLLWIVSYVFNFNPSYQAHLSTSVTTNCLIAKQWSCYKLWTKCPWMLSDVISSEVGFDHYEGLVTHCLQSVSF